MTDDVRKYEHSPRSSLQERSGREAFIKLFEQSPIPRESLFYNNLSVYLPRQELSRLLALADIYRNHVVDSAGVMMEFGTWAGRTAVTLTNLRGALEPFNFTRRLVIFDTFDGLSGVNALDGAHDLAKDKTYSISSGYDSYLEKILSYHESEAQLSHIRKFEIVKGDASVTVPKYFETHPETIVSLAYFDFDIFAPTRDCLKAILPHLTKASVLVFDQLNCPEYPGETVALHEVIGLGKVKIRRSPLTPWMTYMLAEDFL